ncbi:FAD:protein FMN transferase [Clostridium estertheticum]|uniref:FAD:protein FMN transferase n=1 Tax=Clostridium estertheticum TaxID=238834 RepID=A0AA47ENC1_9CLOT|nr:FAD:protein FMN transferase [Clostridium estertheticum]MBU3157490.1 FAD:protein FMN transferase [Clostridium estertheticum]WAG62181.1 FAD:protein FMN transferase [Clostridium estertheticum]
MLIIDNVLIIIIALIFIILILIFITGNNKKSYIVRKFYSLGTSNQLKVYGKKATKAIEESIIKVCEIDNKMSVFKEESEISKISINAGNKPQIVSNDTYYVIQKAIKYCTLSEGAFDITIKPIVALWGIGKEGQQIPSSNEVKEKLKIVNYKDIVIDKNDRSIFLKNKKQEIDVGGIAKGYAADEVKNVMIKNGIKSALINLGGNILTLGTKIDGTPWSVGIQDPFKTRGEFALAISVINKSVVTSGNYERYFEVEGKRFHHIINPSTGYPSESDIVGATIISDNSIDGDGLSTGVYIMGVQKAIKLIEEIEGVDAILITKSKEIYVTSGMKGKFTITSHEFVYKNRI